MGMSGPVEFLLYLGSGALLAAFNLVLLRHSVSLFARQASAIRIITLYLFRLAAAGFVFWIIAKHGAPGLLLALAGFMVTRLLFQRHALRS